MKARVIKFDVDWLEIKNLCRQTINMGDSIKEPTSEWKRKLLIAEHSPLRHSLITVEIEDVPFYVMGHLVRHNMGVTPYVGTSREDRTGIDRNERKQTDLVNMRMDLNIQALLNISSKRLCNCADRETIRVWDAVLNAIKEYDEDIYWACVPSGIKHGGCTEPFSDCKMCNNILKSMPLEQVIDINERYNQYALKMRK